MKYTVHGGVSTYDCDCCGFYSSGDVTIKVNGSKYTLSHDGHFGGGCWNGENETIPLHVIGMIHGVTEVKVIDPDWSWGVFSHNDTVPRDNQCMDYFNAFWANATSVTVEIRLDQGVYQFYVDGKLIFDHNVFVHLFGEAELELQARESYMLDHDLWETVCKHYISVYEELNEVVKGD